MSATPGAFYATIGAHAPIKDMQQESYGIAYPVPKSQEFHWPWLLCPNSKERRSHQSHCHARFVTVSSCVVAANGFHCHDNQYFAVKWTLNMIVIIFTRLSLPPSFTATTFDKAPPSLSLEKLLQGDQHHNRADQNCLLIDTQYIFSKRQSSSMEDYCRLCGHCRSAV